MYVIFFYISDNNCSLSANINIDSNINNFISDMKSTSTDIVNDLSISSTINDLLEKERNNCSFIDSSQFSDLLYTGNLFVLQKQVINDIIGFCICYQSSMNLISAYLLFITYYLLLISYLHNIKHKIL